MEEVERMRVAFEAARLYKGILSGDSCLVDGLLRTLPAEYLYPVYNSVVHELSTDADTDGLDIIKKREISGCRSQFMELFSELQQFMYERKLIERELTGYPKYQAMSALLGKDPMSYHEWQERWASMSSVR